MTYSAADFEKLGVFYLGRALDPRTGEPAPTPLLYESKDLVTHAVCVGMTGSGKTGLCVDLIEEAAIDGIPAIVVDPKGDLANLLLGFPALAAADFAPWVDADEARRQGQTVEALAQAVAERWKKGLAEWGQDGARIQRMRDAAELAVYTPGAPSGRPLSILAALSAPKELDQESRDKRVQSVASSLLGLAGVEADPLKSREHVLLSSLIARTWSLGQEVELANLIREVQAPPISKVGLLDIESFYPAKERFALVLALNNLLASPSFAAWLEGEPLDIAALLFSPAGKPRVSVLSLAHLGDAERMFFVTLLLNQLVGWMRAQPGTSSLRALFYMDEIFGYFPPVAQPPSKAPLLLLLKQARAFGLGLVLATQNPVDLDYKGLGNAGTWFIGRLLTERDRLRVLDGLESAAAAGGRSLDRAELEKLLAGLAQRTFLMNNVHEDQPVLFQSRWALSYLRGPLSLEQIRRLSDRPAGRAAPASAPALGPPPLPPEVPAHHLAPRGRPPEGARLLLRPFLLGAATVSFEDKKRGLNLAREEVYLAALDDGPRGPRWDEAEKLELDLDLVQPGGVEGAAHQDLPPAAARAKSYEEWKKALLAHVFTTSSLDLFTHPALKESSLPGENERDFRARVQLALREERDRAQEALKKKYAPKLAALAERLRKAEGAVEREKAQAQSQKLDTAVAFGTTLLGALFGRKLGSSRNVGRAASAMKSASRSMKESGDVARAEESVEAVAGQLAELEAEHKAELEATAARFDAAEAPLEALVLRPTKSKIQLVLLTLCWVPYFVSAGGEEKRAPW